MHRCTNCGSTNIDELEPLDNGSTYCAGCDRVTRPEPPTPPAAPERTRRDLE